MSVKKTTKNNGVTVKANDGNYTLTQTGAEVQADLDFTESVAAAISSATAGQALVSDGDGGVSVTDMPQAGILYKHTIVIGNHDAETLNCTAIVINDSSMQFSFVSEVLKYTGNLAIPRIHTLVNIPGEPMIDISYRNVIITPGFVFYGSSNVPDTIYFGPIDENYFIPGGVFIVSDTVTPI